MVTRCSGVASDQQAVIGAIMNYMYECFDVSLICFFANWKREVLLPGSACLHFWTNEWEEQIGQ